MAINTIYIYIYIVNSIKIHVCVQVICLYVTGALNTILHNQHRQEMCRYLYNHQVYISISISSSLFSSSSSSCWGFRLPHARTGGVLIVAHWRLSTLTQYFTWFGKSPISTGESHCIRDRERITTQYMEEEDHIHSNSTPSSHTLLHIAAGLLPMAAAPLSLFFSSLHSHTLSHFSLKYKPPL